MIVLRRLRVAALKQLRDIDMRFPERGSVLIEGSNEAGKSTLFEAIYFALYGAALVGEDAHANLAALTPHGATDADAALTFQIGETELEVRRTLNSTKRQMHDAALTVRRPGVAPERLHGPRAVNDRILQELGGLDGDALRNSCLMEQQALDRIESLSRTDREEAIANLLGLKRLIAIEVELKITAEDRAQVALLREHLRLAREVAARRHDADYAQTTADALALRLRVAETLALIADRDADAARRRDGAQRAALLTDEIGQLEAHIAQAQRISALARRLDGSASLQREATQASDALGQTDARLATLARIAHDDLPQAEWRLSELRTREATLAGALRARDAALADLRAAQADVRQGQALAETRQQRAQTLARLAAATANADATYQQAHATLAEAERVADAARQAEAHAQHAADTHAAAYETLTRWATAQAAADAHASADATAQAGARDASETATRLSQQRDASDAQFALARQRAQQARTPTLIAAAVALGALLVTGATLANHNVIVMALSALAELVALVACALLGVRWRRAVAVERAASADHQATERAAYEATARRDALLVALRDSALRDSALRATNLRLANPPDIAPNNPPSPLTPGASYAALATPAAETLAAMLRAVGLATPTTLATGRATLATLDAQAISLRQTLQTALAATRAAELHLAHARAADEAAQRQRVAAHQAANDTGDAVAAGAETRGETRTHSQDSQDSLAPPMHGDGEPMAMATLTVRLTQAEQAYAAAEGALASARDQPDQPQSANATNATEDRQEAHDPSALAAQRGAAHAVVMRLQAELLDRESLTERRNEQAPRAQATLAALRTALTTAQREADALALPPATPDHDLHSAPDPQAAPQATHAHTLMATTASLTDAIADATTGATTDATTIATIANMTDVMSAAEPVVARNLGDDTAHPADDPITTLATLAAWRAQLATAVAAALGAYDEAQLHARLGASRAEHEALAAQLADRDAQSTRIERIRTAFAAQGVACAGDEPLAELAVRWPTLTTANARDANAQDADSPHAPNADRHANNHDTTPTPTPLLSVPLPLGEGQPRAAGDAAGWGHAPADLRRAFEQARRQADEARGAATQATALLRDHAGTADSMATPTGDVTGADVRAVVTSDGAMDDMLDEDASRMRLADAERGLRRRELAAQMARDVRARIARRVLPETEAYMRALLPELTAGRYRDVELLREDGAGQGGRGAGGADLRIRVWDQLAGRFVAKGLFSGGARDQVSLALRLAFALATLPKELGAIPGFIFLDEPLSAFDAERSAALERLLTRGVIARQFPQVFLISHSQSLDPAHFDFRVRMAAGRIVETNLPGA